MGRHQGLWWVVVVCVALGACGQPGSSTTVATAPAPATASPATTAGPIPTATIEATAGTVKVVTDLVYQAASTSHGLTSAAKLMDVYAPADRQGGPMIVLFHAAGFSKDGDREGSPDQQDALKDLAMAVAERGAVAFVPTWRNPDDWDEPAGVSGLSNDVDASRCAVSYALSRGAEYGADTKTLILVGRSAGSNMAATAALSEATPVPGCAVAASTFVADGMVLWEGDWLLADSEYDSYGETLRSMLDTATPWSRLAAGPKPAIDLVTTAGFRLAARRCPVAADPDDPFFTFRDPKGSYRLYERFAAIGAMDDTCIDVGEIDQVLGATMTEAGFDVMVVQLEHGEHGNLGEDKPLVVDEILAIPER
jgi:hypothetical protein